MLVTVVVRLAPDDARESVPVSLEPEGALHVLARGDCFRIEARPPQGRTLEVADQGDALTVWAESAWGTRAWNGAADELKL